MIVDTSTEKRLCQFHLPVALKGGWSETRLDAFNARVFAEIDRAKEADAVADLSGIGFPGEVTFERYAEAEDALPELMCRQVVFGGPVSFDRVRFTRAVDFQQAEFHGDAHFARAIFGGDAVFRSTKFAGISSFEKVRFEHVADFLGAEFRGHALFKRAVFKVVAEFRGTNFHDAADFRRAWFGDLNFTGVRFMEATWFSGSKFRGDAWFRGVKFYGDSEFQEVTFEHDTVFSGAEFSGYAAFHEVVFGGDASFDGDEGRADTFSGFVMFPGARFAKRAVFTNRRFVQGADFRGAVFKLAPEFHNAILHQDTRFAGTLFLDRKGTEAVDAASAYRTLKLAMESVRARDEEAMFYAYEQESLRAKRETPWSVRLFSLLYEQTADYGRSFMRPLVWLVLGFFLFLLSYALVGGQDMWEDGGSVLRFALQQVFQPFWAFRPGADVPGQAQTVPVWLALMAALQSVLTLTFLTLFLLALRRRFRLD